MNGAPQFRCARCPDLGWTPGDTPEFQAHQRTRHGDRPITPLDWETTALQLIRAAATTGRTFTIAEILTPIGEHPEPDRRQSINGVLTRRVATQGLIEPVGATESAKPTTHFSLVRQWRGVRSAAA